MKYLYAGSICATRNIPGGMRVDATCIVFNAANDMEAVGIATTYCTTHYPPINGYFNHFASALKAADEYVQNDVRVIVFEKGA